jgi:hypothetical protein
MRTSGVEHRQGARHAKVRLAQVLGSAPEGNGAGGEILRLGAELAGRGTGPLRFPSVYSSEPVGGVPVGDLLVLVCDTLRMTAFLGKARAVAHTGRPSTKPANIRQTQGCQRVGGDGVNVFRWAATGSFYVS